MYIYYLSIKLLFAFLIKTGTRTDTGIVIIYCGLPSTLFPFISFYSQFLAEERRSLDINRTLNEPANRMSIDTAPMGIEMKMRNEEIQEKKKKGQKLTREDMKKEVDIVCRN